MGKITDAAVALFVIIIGFFVLYRLGITLPVLEHVLRNFFSPPSPAPSNNTTLSFIFIPLAATNFQFRENIIRILRVKHLKGAGIRENNGDKPEQR